MARWFTSITSAQEIGSRDEQEDRILAVPDSGVFCVADGMGGHACGAEAAQEAVSAFLERFLRTQVPFLVADMLACMQAANLATCNVPRHEHGRRPGTTLTAVQFGGDVLLVGHVGDSRCYRLVDDDDVFEQITRDHTAYAEAQRRGQVIDSHYRHVLTQALGREDVEIDVFSLPQKPGRYLICSDGLTDALDDAHIATLLRAGCDAKGLIKAALDRQHRKYDNMSVIVIHYAGVPLASADKDRYATPMVSALDFDDDDDGKPEPQALSEKDIAASERWSARAADTFVPVSKTVSQQVTLDDLVQRTVLPPLPAVKHMEIRHDTLPYEYPQIGPRMSEQGRVVALYSMAAAKASVERKRGQALIWAKAAALLKAQGVKGRGTEGPTEKQIESFIFQDDSLAAEWARSVVLEAEAEAAKDVARVDLEALRTEAQMMIQAGSDRRKELGTIDPHLKLDPDEAFARAAGAQARKLNS